MEEIWKDIPDYEGLYQVSSLGRVRSIRYNKTQTLKVYDDLRGYLSIKLHNNKKIKNYKIHQLVAMAFLGHKPCGYKLVIDHINDNPSDNRVENLQLIEQRENCRKTQGKYSSKYKGVYKIEVKGKNNVYIYFRSTIYLDKKNKNLGIFKSEYEAHLAYQNALQEYNLI